MAAVTAGSSLLEYRVPPFSRLQRAHAARFPPLSHRISHHPPLTRVQAVLRDAHVQAVLKDAHVDLAAARQRRKGVVVAVDGAVEKLRETLRAMTDGEQVTADLALPYVEALVGAEGVRSLAFTFHRPSHVHVVGSFAHSASHAASHPASHTHVGADGGDEVGEGGEGGEGGAAGVGSVTRPCTHVDVAVEMPPGCVCCKYVLNRHATTLLVMSHACMHALCCVRSRTPRSSSP
ncbi:unnamed protein product [Closterium sp. NIES-65]|nr:unnamed protein product [Closterium sp. NIES-65]